MSIDDLLRKAERARRAAAFVLPLHLTIDEDGMIAVATSRQDEHATKAATLDESLRKFIAFAEAKGGARRG